jgi:hypothetical protein
MMCALGTDAIEWLKPLHHVEHVPHELAGEHAWKEGRREALPTH